jgi:hypothetical protein
MDRVRNVAGCSAQCQSRDVADDYRATDRNFDSQDTSGPRPSTHWTSEHLSPWNPWPQSRVTSPLTEAWHRALDGKHVWGSVDIGLPKQGFRWYRLTVFPPGITEADRRRVRLARGWPTWGAVMFVASLVCLSATLGPGIGLATSTTLWLGAGLLAFGRAGDVRAHVRTLSVALIDRHHDPRTAARFALLETVVDLLTQADLLLARGQISAAQHELIWGLAYDRVAPDHPDSTEHPQLG